jgi:hypothetical protein
MLFVVTESDWPKNKVVATTATTALTAMTMITIANMGLLSPRLPLWPEPGVCEAELFANISHLNR